jgi:hypothetical protein
MLRFNLVLKAEMSTESDIVGLYKYIDDDDNNSIQFNSIQFVFIYMPT